MPSKVVWMNGASVWMQQVDIEIMGTGDGSVSNEIIMLG